MSNLATIVNNILADSGIDDINVVVTTGSYNNPAWITGLSWSKITSTPTTLSGYGITDAVPAIRTITINGLTQDLSANRTWTITAGVSSVSAGTGISVNQTTGAVIVTNTGVLSVNGSTGSITGVLTTSNYTSYAVRFNDTFAYSSGLDNNTVIPNSFTLFDGYGAPVPGYPAADAQWWVGAATIGNASRGFQIAGGYSDSNMYYRKGSNTWQSWIKVLNDLNYTSYAVQTTNQSNWNSYSVIANVVGLLAWKNYGNSHVIFDASASTSPSGTAVNNTNSSAAWAATYPTLMGWNGSQTYGVRVDSARISDNTSGNSATTSQTNFSTLTLNSATVATQSWVQSQGYVTGGPFLALSGGTMTGDITWTQTDRGLVWTMNTDGAYIKFYNTGDGDTNSRLEYGTSDNGDEYHRFMIAGTERFTVKGDAVRFNNNIILNAANYNSYSPTLTGGGASGTWGINVTGTAGSTQTLALIGLGNGSMNVSNPNTAVYRNENSLGAALPYAPVLHVGGGDTMWQAQGSYGTSGNGTLYFRQGYNGSWGNWLTMLSSANYNSYSPTLTGGGASGLWSINITGTAASETLATVVGRGNNTGGNRPITLDTGGGAIITRASGGGWAMGTYYQGVSGGTLAGFGAYGGNDSLTYAWIGPSYDVPWMTINSGTTTFNNAVNINGVWSTTISTTGGWNKLSFVASNAWGDGTTYGVLGAGGGSEPGVMVYNMHATWAGSGNGAGVRMGRSGGVTSGAWYQVATMDSDEFMIAKTGQWSNGGLKIASNGLLYYGNTGHQFVYNTGTWGISITGDAGSVDGIDSSRIVYGTNATKSTAFDGGDMNSALACGFYDGYNMTGAPTATTYYHLITSRHNNTGNNYQMQFAGNFFNSGQIYYRIIDSGSASTWGQIWTSQNDGVGSGLDADLLDGYQPSTSATANTIALRDSVGDIVVRELVMNVGVQDFTPSSMVAIYPTTNQAVKVTASGARTFLNVPTRTGGDASGTWGISITGNADTVDGYHESAFMRYYGYSASGNFQTFQAIPGRLRFDQVGDINSGAWSNAPTGIYPYGGLLSYRGDSFGLQIYASHVGGMVYKTQWNDDQYSGWLRILDTQNFNSYVPTLTGVNASGTWGINITGSAGSVAFNNLTSKTGGTGTYQTSGDFRAPTFYNGRYTYWDCGVAYAPGEGANKFEIGRIGIDFNDWNGVGTFEVELQELYFYAGGRKRYVISYGYGGPVIRCDLVELNGVGSFGNYKVTVGPEVVVGGDWRYLPIYVEIKYYSQVAVQVRTTRNITNSTVPEVGYAKVFTSPAITGIGGFSVDDTVYPTSQQADISNPVIRASTHLVTPTIYSGGGNVTFGNNIGLSGANSQIQFLDAASSDLYVSCISGTRTLQIRNNNAGSPNYLACGLITGYATFVGSITVSSGNITGGGIILADDGDIVDLNDGYCAMRFSSGVRIHSANRGGSAVITLGSNGNVTASAFFESSDMRLKEVIDQDYRSVGIEKIKPKLYKKNGKIELGYYAQDFESLLPYAVTIGEDYYLNLSYSSVHTAKIAYLEDSIEEIKAKILYLEQQLKNKNNENN
jgi:hypothetical protein